LVVPLRVKVCMILLCILVTLKSELPLLF
jgi:hypothetical protein